MINLYIYLLLFNLLIKTLNKRSLISIPKKTFTQKILYTTMMTPQEIDYIYTRMNLIHHLMYTRYGFIDEDIIQEAILKLYLSPTYNNSLSKSITYLMYIIKNIVIRNAQNKLQLTYTDDIPDLQSTQDISDSITSLDYKSVLEEAIMRLRPDLAEVINCQYKDKMSMKEISAKLNISEQVVKNKIRRAKFLLCRMSILRNIYYTDKMEKSAI